MYVDWPSHLVVRQSEVRISPKLGTSSWQHLFLNLLALVFPRHRSMHIPCRSPPLQSDLFPCPFRFHPGLSISYAFHHRASPPRISEGPFLLPRPPPSCASQGVARPSFPPQKWRFHPSRETVRVVLAAAAAVRVPPRNPIPMQGHRGRIDRGRTRGSPPAPGFLGRPGVPPDKRGGRMPPFRGVPGGSEPRSRGEGGRSPSDGEENGHCPSRKGLETRDLLHEDRTREGVLDVRGVPPGSVGFPPGIVPRQWDPSVGGLLSLFPTDSFPGGGSSPRRSQTTKFHRTVPRDGQPREGAGRSEETSDHVTHEGMRITDGLWIGRC